MTQHFFIPIQVDNADDNEAQLDEEMEKVFSEPNITKFDVRKLSDINKPASSTKLDTEQPSSFSNPRFTEHDYECKKPIYK